MIAFTLELVNLFLLLKGILGYDFRRNRICTAVGIGLILFRYAAFLWFSQELPMTFDYGWIAMPIISLMLLFKGKLFTLLGIGISIRMIFSMMESLSLGIWILASGGKGRRHRSGYELQFVTGSLHHHSSHSGICAAQKKRNDAPAC